MSTKQNLGTTALIAGSSELLRKLPGASTTLTVVQEVFRRRAEQRATELFTAIGIATGAADPEDAAAKLAANIDQPWFQEAIEAGFRELMDSTDPAVRSCIAVLVAEYVVMCKPPDLKFRRAGAVLQDTAGTALPTLLAIAEEYAAVSANAGPGHRVLIRGRRAADVSDHFWVASPRTDGPGLNLSDGRSVNSDFEDCTRALMGGGVGRGWAGLSSSQFHGNPLIAFDPADDATVRLLQVCIHTSEQQMHVASNQVDEP